MKRRILAALPLIFVLTSCASLFGPPAQSIDASTAGPLILDVCDQHDESVARDPQLVQAEKDQALRSTAMLREIVREATAR